MSDRSLKTTLLAALITCLFFIFTGSATASTAAVMTSGPVTGTQLVHITIDANGSIAVQGLEKVDGGQATHGGYLNQRMDRMYINGFTGGGMQVFGKLGDSWSLIKSAPTTFARMNCATDLKAGWEDPNTGLLTVGEISNGFTYEFDMSKDEWASQGPSGEMGYFQGVGTNCDTAYAENPRSGMAWSSGHSNIIYTWDFNTPAALPVQLPIGSVPTLKNVRPNATTLGHQNRTFSMPDGHEYVAIADGSAGQFVIFNTADDSEVGRITVGGEAHAMGIAVDGPKTNRLISPYAITANFADGSIKAFRLVKADGSINLDGDGQVKPTVTGSIPAVGSAADICGVDIAMWNGSWMRN